MFILQMTGLSGAGKTTLAQWLKAALEAESIPVVIIDADVYRKSLNKDLGFSAADRRENIRRLGSVAEAFRREGKLAVIAAINPFEDVRAELRSRYDAKLLWVRCPLEQLVWRDPKGLYRRALLPDGAPAKLRNLTGINDVYEEPAHPDLIIDTDKADVAGCTRLLVQFVLEEKNRLSTTQMAFTSGT